MRNEPKYSSSGRGSGCPVLNSGVSGPARLTIVVCRRRDRHDSAGCVKASSPPAPSPPRRRRGGVQSRARFPQGGDTLVVAEGRLVVVGSRTAREGARSPGERVCLTLGYCRKPLRGFQMGE